MSVNIPKLLDILNDTDIDQLDTYKSSVITAIQDLYFLHVITPEAFTNFIEKLNPNFRSLIDEM